MPEDFYDIKPYAEEFLNDPHDEYFKGSLVKEAVKVYIDLQYSWGALLLPYIGKFSRTLHFEAFHK